MKRPVELLPIINETEPDEDDPTLCAFDWRNPWTLVCSAHGKPHFVVTLVTGASANLQRLNALGFLTGQAQKDARGIDSFD